MRKNIELLISSGITAYQVAKDTQLPRNTAYRIFNGEASLDNVSLKNAEILNDYYLKLKSVNTPILLSVYQADNGDVFLRHGNTNQDISLVNEYELLQQALNDYRQNNMVQCSAKHETTYNSLSYYTIDGVFIGTADIHIRDHFNKIQDFIYLSRSNEKKLFGRFDDDVEKTLNSLNNN